MHDLGFVLLSLRDPDHAAPLYREVLERYTRTLGENHPDTLGAEISLCDVLIQQRKYGDAEQLCRKSLDKSRVRSGPSGQHTLSAMSVLANLLFAQGKSGDAEPYLREVLQHRQETAGERDPLTIHASMKLAADLTELGKFAEAERLLLEAGGTAAAALSATHRAHQTIAGKLAYLYETWDSTDPGKPHGAKAAEWKARLDELRSTSPAAGGK